MQGDSQLHHFFKFGNVSDTENIISGSNDHKITYHYLWVVSLSYFDDDYL
jgi:hypothetical protein